MAGLSTFIRRLRTAAHPPLRAGDWVEVKSREAILASLDQSGNLDGMPFMPEMLEFCGQRFQVSKRAHKTCEYSQGMTSRRVPSTVHLDDLRCTGEAHAGCQAECLLFWKETWLTPVAGPTGGPTRSQLPVVRGAPGCTEEQLQAVTIASTEPETIYSCQATRIRQFTTPLHDFELDQYVEAYASGNVRVRDMFAPLVFRVYDRLVHSRLGRGGVLVRIYDAFQRVRGGRPFPHRPGKIPSGQRTPRGEPLNLQPGELVRVKKFDRILETVNEQGFNRGLLFSQEHVPFCGNEYRVHGRVERIIDEKNGRMLTFKSDCIVLENVACQARYNAGLAFCPRADLPYWREIWLERVNQQDAPPALSP